MAKKLPSKKAKSAKKNETSKDGKQIVEVRELAQELLAQQTTQGTFEQATEGTSDF